MYNLDFKSGSPSELLSTIGVYNEGFNLNSVIRGEPRNQALNGSFYSLTTGSQTVAAANFLVCQVTNPSNSGKFINVNDVLGSSTTPITVDVLRNATFAAAGTAITPRNTNFQFGDNSAMTGKFLVSVTDPTSGGNLLYSINQGNGGPLVDFNGRIIVPSNQTLYIRLPNTGSTSINLSLTVDWWE